MAPSGEDGLSTTLLILVFLSGWIGSYSAAQRLNVAAVKVPAPLTEVAHRVVGLFTPYLSLWILFIVSFMLLFLVDKLLASILSLTAEGNVTFMASTATSLLLRCFTQYRVFVAAAMTMAIMASGYTVVIMWARKNRFARDDYMQTGLSIVNIFSLIVFLHLAAFQGYVIG